VKILGAVLVLFCIWAEAQSDSQMKAQTQTLPQKISDAPIWFSTSGTNSAPTLELNSPNFPTVTVHCERWDPKPRDCKIESGKNLDDLVWAMSSVFIEKFDEMEQCRKQTDMLMADEDRCESGLTEALRRVKAINQALKAKP